MVPKDKIVGSDGEGAAGVNEVDLLKAIPLEERLRMAQLIYELRHLVQYSTEPSQQLIR